MLYRLGAAVSGNDEDCVLCKAGDGIAVVRRESVSVALIVIHAYINRESERKSRLTGDTIAGFTRV